MKFFTLPDWVKSHYFDNRRFEELSDVEINRLKNKLARFNDPDPEVTIAIPAWNEERDIFRTLSSFSESQTQYRTEIVVINNNSTDKTQSILDTLGVTSYQQPIPGTQYARQMGLEKARGKFMLCADSDTIYPPLWVDLMIAPLKKDPGISCVYGNHAFIPSSGNNRLGLSFYELFSEVAVFRRKRNREYINAYGFNMGFEIQKGLKGGGFKLNNNSRVYANANGADFFNESEDGRMALNLMAFGRMHRVSSGKATVFTSSRRLMDEGSIAAAFTNRAKHQLKSIFRS